MATSQTNFDEKEQRIFRILKMKERNLMFELQILEIDEPGNKVLEQKAKEKTTVWEGAYNDQYTDFFSLMRQLSVKEDVQKKHRTRWDSLRKEILQKFDEKIRSYGGKPEPEKTPPKEEKKPDPPKKPAPSNEPKPVADIITTEAQLFTSLETLYNNEVEDMVRPSNLEIFKWRAFPNIFFVDSRPHFFMRDAFERMTAYTKCNQPLMTRDEMLDYAQKYGTRVNDRGISNDIVYYSHILRASEIAKYLNNLHKRLGEIKGSEKHLMTLLKANNIIEGSLGSFTGKSGVIVAGFCYWYTGYAQRKKSIYHVAIQAVYHTDATFRQLCDKFWNQQDKGIQDFFRLYLKGMRYARSNDAFVKSMFAAFAINTGNFNHEGNFKDPFLMHYYLDLKKNQKHPIEVMRKSFRNTVRTNGYGYLLSK